MNKCIAIFLAILTLFTTIYTHNILYGSKIDLNDYPIATRYGILSDNEIEVVNEIFDAIDKNERNLNAHPLYDSVQRINWYLTIHYGVTNLWPIIGYDADTQNYYLHLQSIAEAEKERVVVDAKIDEILSTLYEGSDEYKLWQIANCISDMMTYDLNGINVLHGINGYGKCTVYTMLFYKMAARLGYEVYYCTGYASGGNHAWNMVVLDGVEYYYDITWYDDDIMYNYKYLHNKDAWGREYKIVG